MTQVTYEVWISSESEMAYTVLAELRDIEKRFKAKNLTRMYPRYYIHLPCQPCKEQNYTNQSILPRDCLSGGRYWK